MWRIVLACLILASCAKHVDDPPLPVPPVPPAVARPIAPAPVGVARRVLMMEAMGYAGRPGATAAGMAEYRERLR